MADIFISYATSADKPDKNIANQIKDRLLQEKFSVFIDSGLEPGARWDTELDRENKDARAVVAVWSEFSLTRDWVTKECSVALRRNTLIPLTIERVDPNNMPVAFENLQYISFDSQSDIQWQSLLRAIRRLLKIKDDSLSSSGPEQPIVLTSSSAIAYNIKSALDDLSKGRIIIPPYQRDANQWDVANSLSRPDRKPGACGTRECS